MAGEEVRAIMRADEGGDGWSWRKRHMGALVWAVILLGTSALGCGSRTVKGQVFIVTKGHESVKLGLVDVHLLSEASARKYIEARRTEISADSAESAAEIDSMQTVLGQAQERASAAAIAYSLARKRGDKSEMAKEMALIQQCDATVASCMAAFDTYRTRQDELKRQAHLLHGLPNGITHTQTDANGEFVLKLPPWGRFVLAAQAQRQVVNDTEVYVWLVLIPNEARKGATVLLSNQNLLEQGSPLAVR